MARRLRKLYFGHEDDEEMIGLLLPFVELYNSHQERLEIKPTKETVDDSVWEDASLEETGFS